MRDWFSKPGRDSPTDLNMWFSRNKDKPVIAISMAPSSSPWGGSSPFVWQLMAVLNRRGYRVIFHLRERPDAIVMIDPRRDHPAKRFGLDDLRAFLRTHPDVPVLHRINECDQRKGTNDIDILLRDTHALASHTVFISEWLKDYFSERWFDPASPHSVIYNGADPRIYHPIGNRLPGEGEPFRVVTHHWSPHMLKGFDVYQALDDLLAKGRFPNVRLRVIGRWPESIDWKAAELLPPSTGRLLAGQLRDCHLYLTASRWEPCGMHHVEGAQCGLPLLFHEDGGGIVEAGRRYGLGFRDDLEARMEEAIERHVELRQKVLTQPPDGDRMALAFVEILQRLVASNWNR